MTAMLFLVGPREFQARNLGNGIPFVCRLERARQQAIFRHRLGREARVDAGRAQKQQVLDVQVVCCVDHVGLDGQILAQKLCRVGIIGKDAANLRGCKHHRIRFFAAHPVTHSALVAQVERVAVGGQ
jgi:hypothetical protein